MQIDKSDRIIRSATIIGSRRIGPKLRSDQQGEPAGEQVTDTGIAQRQTAADAPTEYRATLDSTPQGFGTVRERDAQDAGVSDDEASWEESVFSSLDQEVESLKKYNQQLEKELQEARGEYDTLLGRVDDERQRATEQGKAAGYEEGLQQAREEHERRVGELTTLADSLRGVTEVNWEQFEDLAVQIGLSALIKVVGDNLGTRELARASVEEAVRKVRHEHRLKVRLSPRDYSLLEEEFEQLEQQLSPAGLDFVADSRVELGGCILESDRGSWDARLETQLQRLKDVINPSMDNKS